jgi:hypothetical protein
MAFADLADQFTLAAQTLLNEAQYKQFDVREVERFFREGRRELSRLSEWALAEFPEGQPGQRINLQHQLAALAKDVKRLAESELSRWNRLAVLLEQCQKHGRDDPSLWTEHHRLTEDTRQEFDANLRDARATLSKVWMLINDIKNSLRSSEQPPIPPPDPTTIWYHGTKSYSCDGKPPISVATEIHDLLQAFLDNDASKTTNELEDVVNNVAKLVKKVETKFGNGPVRRPPRKGEGYQIRVKSLLSN